MQFIQAQQAAGAVLTGLSPKQEQANQSDGQSGNGFLEDAFASMVEALSQQAEQEVEQTDPGLVSGAEGLPKPVSGEPESFAQPVAVAADEAKPWMLDLADVPGGKATKLQFVEQAATALTPFQAEAGVEKHPVAPPPSARLDASSRSMDAQGEYPSPSGNIKYGNNSDLLAIADDLPAKSETLGVKLETQTYNNASRPIVSPENESSSKDIRPALSSGLPVIEAGEILSAMKNEARAAPHILTSEAGSKPELKPAILQAPATRNALEMASTMAPAPKVTPGDGRVPGEVGVDVNATSVVDLNKKKGENEPLLVMESRSDRRMLRDEGFRWEMKGEQRVPLQSSVMDGGKLRGAPETPSAAQTPMFGLVSSEQNSFFDLSRESAIPVDEVSQGSLIASDQRISTPPQLGRAAIDLPRQISAQLIEVMRSGVEKPIELQLHPEELGRVRLTFQTDASSLNVVLQMERPETLELMRRHIELLAQDIRELGYEDVNFSFQQGDGAFESGAQEGKRSADQSGTDNETASEVEAKMLRLSVGGSDRMDIRL